MFFFFNDTATTEIYTLSLHDALPIYVERTFDHYLPMNPLFRIEPRMQPGFVVANEDVVEVRAFRKSEFYNGWARRSEEHTSELQSRQYLVCRLLLEKKQTSSRRCGIA